MDELPEDFEHKNIIDLNSLRVADKVRILRIHLDVIGARNPAAVCDSKKSLQGKSFFRLFSINFTDDFCSSTDGNLISKSEDGVLFTTREKLEDVIQPH